MLTCKIMLINNDELVIYFDTLDELHKFVNYMQDKISNKKHVNIKAQNSNLFMHSDKILYIDYPVSNTD